MEKITMEKKRDTFTWIVIIYYIKISLSLSESLSPTTRSIKEKKIQNKRERKS